jgi:hypothetical protein
MYTELHSSRLCYQHGGDSLLFLNLLVAVGEYIKGLLQFIHYTYRSSQTD